MSIPRYFQGSSVTGPVTASTARTFAEVVDILRVCPVLGIGNTEFLALSKKERNEIKQVPFFVPATFRTSPSKRNYEHALHCNLIFLDIDELPDGTCPAAPFIDSPELLKDMLKGFSFAAHTTASSTPEKPRMRIIVDADRIPLSEYARAVATIGSMIGLPSITRESAVAVQPMFLPTLFQDSAPEWHPLIAYNIDGRQFSSRDIKDSLDSLNGVNGSNGKHKATNGHVVVDALEFLKAPADEVSLAMVREALEFVDADCSRDVWVMAAAAMKHQFSPHQDEDAFALFDEWSSRGSKYGGEEETRYTWGSVKQTAPNRLPVTIRSLLREAVEGGWNDKRATEHLLHHTIKRFESAENVMDLVDNGIKRILATPLMGAMQEDMLVNSLAQQARERFSYKITPSAIRKDLQKLKAEIRLKEEPVQKDPEAPWAKDVVYVQAADEFFRYRTGERIKTVAFNAAYSRHLMPTKEQLMAASLATGTPTTLAQESTPVCRPSDYALNKLRLPTYHDYAYNPALPGEKMFLVNGAKFFNIYMPTYPSLDRTRADEAGRLIHLHFSNLIAEPKHRITMIDWMAYQVQWPGRKVRWAPMIQSTEGAGKTLIAEILKGVLGPEHVRVIDGTAIKSGWNEWSFGNQVVVLEEVKVSGTSKYEVMNSLKPLITNDSISINERFRNQREVPNITNYIVFSNHHDALALTPGDRRYFVLKSPLQTKAQVLALGEEYFATIFNFLKHRPGAFRAFLMDWEISDDFDPNGHAPRTEYVQDMVNDSANELTATVRRLLLEGDYPLVQFDIVSATALKNAVVTIEGVKATMQQIAQVLREEGLHQAGRHMIGTERQYLWTRPGISESDALAAALEREKKQLKNLSMELLF